MKVTGIPTEAEHRAFRLANPHYRLCSRAECVALQHEVVRLRARVRQLESPHQCESGDSK